MPNGPGKYDDETTLVRLMTGATGVILIVHGGNKGTGFSVQVADRTLMHALPLVLEDIAREIRASLPAVN